MADSPYQYILATGLVIADTSNILSGVQEEWMQAFGADLVVTPDTVQGVMITASTTNRVNTVNNNAAVANQINPNIAGGIFLDAILALTGVQRNAQTPTVVPNVTLTGLVGVLIPAGVQAKTSDGDIFQSVSAVTLNSGGTAVVNFQSVQSGPIPCPENALTTIVTGVLGWEIVNNTTAGVLGTSTQSDQSARAYRQNTLAFQGLSLAEAVTSALSATTGVTSRSFRENYHDTPMGAIIPVTGGTTLSGTKWGMTNVQGTGFGTDGNIVVGTDILLFAQTAQNAPSPDPWPTAAFATTGNITLSGLATQGGGDWPSTLTAGNIILVKNQSTGTQNGVYVAASGAWTRQGYFANGNIILGSNDGISMIDHSVYACVEGGTDLDVASALLENKSSGSAWVGNSTVPVTEPASGQVYAVKFDRPAEIGILVKITVSNVTTDAVNQAILDYAAGLINGLTGFIIGQDVSPFEISGAVMSENPGCYVSNCQISLSTGSPAYSTNPIAIGLNQIAFTQLSFITVIQS